MQIQNTRQHPATAHLAITTTRFANSLAPRSGERARERGSFVPMAVCVKMRPPATAHFIFVEPSSWLAGKNTVMLKTGLQPFMPSLPPVEDAKNKIRKEKANKCVASNRKRCLSKLNIGGLCGEF